MIGEDGVRRARILVAVAVVAVGSFALAPVAPAPPAAAVVDSVTVVPTPNAGAGLPSYLTGVSCVSASFCVATGYFDSGPFQTLAMTWNGTTWALQSTPNAGSGLSNNLIGVSCVSASFCVATGYSSDATFQTLALVWDGSTWTVTPTPNPGSGTDNLLNKVSCVSVSFCVAVGEYQDGSGWRSLVTVWDGATWAVAPTPDPGVPTDHFLNAVSCVSVSFCVAVGEDEVGSIARSLVLVWDGATWAVAPTPDPGIAADHYVNGVACVSVSSCVAVGRAETAGTSPPLVLVWDGSAWSDASPPDPAPGVGTNLVGVSCTSTSACVATGWVGSPGTPSALVTTWDGVGWSVLATPDVVTPADELLYAVSCASESFCVATGVAGTTSVSRTLALVLRGPDPTPAPPTPRFTG